MKKRFLSMLVALSVIVSSIPGNGFTAFASDEVFIIDDTSSDEENFEIETFQENDGETTVSEGTYEEDWDELIIEDEGEEWSDAQEAVETEAVETEFPETEEATETETEVTETEMTAVAETETSETEIDELLLLEEVVEEEAAELAAEEEIGEYEASIGETKYETLQDAFDEAEDGSTVALCCDIDIADTLIVPEGKALVLDMNGFTLTGTPAAAAVYAVINNLGTLTITGGGKILCNHHQTGSASYAVNTITNCGKLTIENVTVENTSTASYQIGYAIDNNSTSRNAVTVINGGEVKASGSVYYDGIRLFCNSLTYENTLTVNAGTVSSVWMQNPSDGNTEKDTKEVKGAVNITGGTVNALYLEPSEEFTAAITGGYTGSVSYFAEAEGRNLTGFITGGTFGMDVTEFCGTDWEAVKAEDGTYYTVQFVTKATVANLSELKEALKKTYIKEVEVTSMIVVDGEETLDLAGKKVVSGEGVNYAIQALNGNITVKNGSIEAENSAFRVGENNTTKETVTLTIAEDVTVNAGAWGAVTFDGTLNVYGKITAEVGISGNGNPGNVAEVNIEAGAEVKGSDTGIYHPNTGALNVKGGTVEGLTGIYAKAGTVTVTGGTIKGTGAKAEFVPNYSGANPTGDALVLDLTEGYQPGLAAVIKGGNFVSANASAVGSYSSVDGTAALTGFITGGTFSSDVTDFCADGYNSVEKNGVFVADTLCANNGHGGSFDNEWTLVDSVITKNASCTEKGETTYTYRCNVCGKATKTETKADINAAGHTAVTDKAVTATCTSTGKTEGSHCSVCGTVLKAQTTVAMKAHTYGDYVQTKAPTVFATGTKVRTCKDCGHKDSAVVAKLTAILEVPDELNAFNIKKGKTVTFKVEMSAGDSLVSCTSSNKKILKVNAVNKNKGTITLKGVKAGKNIKVKITLKSGKTRTYNVKVTTATIRTTKLTATENTKITLLKGKTKTLSKPLITPFTSTQKLTYKSSNNKVVKAYSTGKIKALKAGTAKITVQSGSKKIVYTVTVPGIDNVKASLTLKRNKSTTLKPKLFGITDKVTYTSSNRKIAAVDAKGKIKALKKGKTTITVKAGKYTVKCKVTVK